MTKTTIACLVLVLVAYAIAPVDAIKVEKKNGTDTLVQEKKAIDTDIDKLNIGQYFWGDEIELNDLKEKVVLVQIAGL